MKGQICLEILTVVCILGPFGISVGILISNIKLRKISIRVSKLTRTNNRAPMHYSSSNMRMRTDP